MNKIIKVISLIILFKLEIILSHGAGVLPYSMTKDNKIYFYIAKEAHDRKPGEKIWLDFGGGFEKEDNDLYRFNHDEAFLEAASREFAEESMEIFTDINGNKLDLHNIKNWLSKNEANGVFYVETVFASGGFIYRTYFMPVENNRGIFKKFTDTRKYLINLRKKGQQFFKGMKIGAMIEKDYLASVNLVNLKRGPSDKVRITGTSDSTQYPQGTEVRLRGAFVKSLKIALKEKLFKKIKQYIDSLTGLQKPPAPAPKPKIPVIPIPAPKPHKPLIAEPVVVKDISELRLELMLLNQNLMGIYIRSLEI